MKTIEYFELPNGKEPFRDWFKKLDIGVQVKVSGYIDRVLNGASRRNIRPVGDSVYEIKINYGPGYRVYFGEVGKVILLLLVGGDKHSQFRNIVTAKKYWREYVQKRRI